MSRFQWSDGAAHDVLGLVKARLSGETKSLEAYDALLGEVLGADAGKSLHDRSALPASAARASLAESDEDDAEDVMETVERASAMTREEIERELARTQASLAEAEQSTHRETFLACVDWLDGLAWQAKAGQDMSKMDSVLDDLEAALDEAENDLGPL